jgi:hypothetical protein
LVGGSLAACSSTSSPAAPSTDAGATADANGACPATGATVRALGNDSAELEGPAFGDGTDPNDALRKVIRVDLLQPEPRVTMGRAHAFDLGFDGFVQFAFPVTNVSSVNLCFLQAEGLRLKDAAGTTLVQPDIGGFVTGSVMAIDPSIWTTTCLLPGEIGWLMDLETSDTTPDLYGSLAAIEFRFSIDEAPSDALPPPRVVPDQYGVAADGIITVCFGNLGTGPAELTAQSFSQYLAVDDAGDPLDFDFLTGRVQPIGLLEPAQRGSVSTKNPSLFRGSAHRMRAFIDFNSPGAMHPSPFHAGGTLQTWRQWREAVAITASRRRLPGPR